MSPKAKDKASEKKKPKKMITMEAKHEIITKYERGICIIDLAKEYGPNPSAISTIIKQKEDIKKLQLSKGVTIISKLRTDKHDEMERLFLIWIKEKQLAGNSVSEAIICEKASTIFQDLKREAAETEGESSQGGQGSDEFKASRGWFYNFKKRSGIHSVICHGEASSADVKGAENFIKEFEKLIFKKYLTDNGLPLKCVLLLDNAPGHPPGLADDLLDEFKFIKVVYLPANTTSILQPMDQQVISNFKKLFTKHLFKRCFEVTENTNLTLREFWKQRYNIVICVKLIDIAWQGVTKRTLNSAWRKLWPDVVLERDFEGFNPVEEEIVSIGRSMGLQIDEADVAEFVEEHAEELMTEELKELHKIFHEE
ncbi:tigger transposable element-derived protein 1-like, partial [Portunus trituberculatus]|uniref:tigger transposable element-derived protein 1-like n=1 Tax=Portunus trituberculatus TaxID=210409 RepID=UPI001E1CBEFF